MILKTTRSKVPYCCSTTTSKSQVSLCFAPQGEISKIIGIFHCPIGRNVKVQLFVKQCTESPLNDRVSGKLVKHNGVTLTYNI